MQIILWTETAAHVQVDPTSSDVENENSWYWIVVRMAYDQRDMAAHAKTTGLAYDGKVKIVISHGLVAMPFLTTRPCLPRLPRTDEPAHGCLLQHATEVNYLGIVNTEAAGVISAMRTCIANNLMCQACLDAMAADEPLPHEQIIV